MSTYAYKDQGKRFSDCEVCLGVFETTKDFCYGTKNCDHYACHDCMRVYLNQEIKNIQRKSYDIIQCPGEECKESFVTDKLVKEVFSAQEAEKWWHMAVSSKAYIKNKVQCPMEDCGAVFDVDDEYTKCCTFTECIECHRGFCITCQSPWHPGVVKVVDNKEALRKTLKVAEDSYWCRCPGCRQVIQREFGCSVIYCICGTEFCYHCGREINSCMDDCELWSMEELDKHRKGMFDYRDEDA